MEKTLRTVTITLFVIQLLFIGGLYFLSFFFRAFAPPSVVLTRDYISTSGSFVNGITIEKIRVDSMGAEGYPTAFTVLYATSCWIHGPANEPSDSPGKIEFNKPGKYSWYEDTVRIQYKLGASSRISLDATGKAWWLNHFGDHPLCPIKFQKGQWYCIDIHDPRVIAIFFYVNESGEEHEYYVGSGISPI
jgi:hypothetical protein